MRNWWPRLFSGDVMSLRIIIFGAMVRLAAGRAIYPFG
jgi:hypothetical protein